MSNHLLDGYHRLAGDFKLNVCDKGPSFSVLHTLEINQFNLIELTHPPSFYPYLPHLSYLIVFTQVLLYI